MSVLTADCLPILIYASDLDVISAIHAGWRGAFSGIINKFIEIAIFVKLWIVYLVNTTFNKRMIWWN